MYQLSGFESKAGLIVSRISFAAVISFHLITLSGCKDFIGTCCCMDTVAGNKVRARDACTANGGICTNMNVCAFQGPSPSPSPTPQPSPVPIIPNFMFNTSVFPGLETELSGHIQASKMPGRSTQAKQNKGDPAECDQECANNGAFCLKVNLRDTDALITNVDKVRLLIMDQARERVATSQLMQIFGVQSDPCARKDTLLTATGLGNSGRSCELTSSIDSQTGNFGFIVQLPPKLEGERHVSNGRLILDFKNAGTSPKLSIGDKGLNADFGGRIRRAAANRDTGIISTTEGCIAVNMQSGPMQ